MQAPAAEEYNPRLRPDPAARHVTEAALLTRASAPGDEAIGLALRLGVAMARVGLTHEHLASGRFEADDTARSLLDLPAQGPLTIGDALAAVHPDDLAAVRAARERALREPGRGIDLRYRVRGGDGGGWRHLQAWRQVLRDSQGQPLVMVAALQDATPATVATQREHQLLQSQAMALELAQLGLWEYRRDTGVVRVDARMREIHGWPDAQVEIDVAQWLEAIDADDRERVIEQLNDVLAGERRGGVTAFCIRRTSGEPRWLRVSAAPLAGADGAIAGIRGAGIDVTDETLARQAREQAARATAERDQAAALAQARSALLSAVSHEVRAPLGAILVGGEQLMRSPLAQDPSLKGWLTLINEAGAHLQGLAEELLRGAAQEQAADDAPAVPLLLERKLRRAQRWLAANAQAAGVTLRIDAASVRGLQVLAPAQRLRQVLLNLIGNAIKYNRPGGWVRCSAEAAEDGRVRLRIEDNGIGMNEAQRKRLFRPFDRAGRDADAGGFGLGLYLVQRLVHAMHGEIELSSSEGIGTCVTLLLPRAESGARAPALRRRAGRAPASPVASAVAGAGVAPCRVLALDDDELSVLLLRAQLAQMDGIAVDTAADLDAALTALAQRPPQLVLVDLHLGALRGEQALQRLREGGYAGPAAAYTGESDPAQHRRLLDSGFAEVWVKPLETAALLAGVLRLSTRAH